MITQLEFRPHLLFPGGHLQTLAGFFCPHATIPYHATKLLLDVSDGDKIALHDDCPNRWAAPDRVVLLLHGLAGCHASGYVARLAERLNGVGIRTFRMDMRGTGAVAGLAKLPAHAGRTEDAAVAIRKIAELCPCSPLTIVGFSMGGNIALNALAEASKSPMGNLCSGIAVCPPVDLSKCCRELQQGTSIFYDKYLIRHLLQCWEATGGEVPQKRPRSIGEFDQNVTAPLSGFEDAEEYYAVASSGKRLCEIRLPTKILAAKDDPVVAFSAIEECRLSPTVELFATRTGGHLGFFGSDAARTGVLGDWRWMDRLLFNWITNQVSREMEPSVETGGRGLGVT